jgi:hypothetical protein
MGEVGRGMRGQRNYIILINIRRDKLRCLKEKVKTKKPEQLTIPLHLLLDVKL